MIVHGSEGDAYTRRLVWQCCLAAPPPIHSVYDMASIVLVQYNEIKCFFVYCFLVIRSLMCL